MLTSSHIPTPRGHAPLYCPLLASHPPVPTQGLGPCGSSPSSPWVAPSCPAQPCHWSAPALCPLPPADLSPPAQPRGDPPGLCSWRAGFESSSAAHWLSDFGQTRVRMVDITSAPSWCLVRTEPLRLSTGWEWSLPRGHMPVLGLEDSACFSVLLAKSLLSPLLKYPPEGMPVPTR